MSIITINIDEGKKCRECRKGGVLQYGLCLFCVGKHIERGDYGHIIKSWAEKTKFGEEK